MNNIYKVIWSKAKNCYVVASEIAKSHTKSASGSEKIGGVARHALLALGAACAIACGGFVNVGASVQSETISPTGTTSNPVLTANNPDDDTQLNKVISAAREDKLVTKDNIGGQLTDYAKASDLSAKADANDVYSKTDAENTFATKTELGSYATRTALDGKANTDLSNLTVDGVNKIKETMSADMVKKADQTDLDAANQKITANEDKITALQRTTNGQQTAIDDLKQRTKEISYVDGDGTRISGVTIKNGNIVGDGNSAITQLANVETDKIKTGSINGKSLTGTTVATEKEVKDVADAVKTETDERNAADTALEEKIAKNTKDIATLDGKVETAEGNITDLKKKDTELEGRIKTNEGDIETNKNAISDINKRTAGIQRIDATKETTIEGNVTVDNLGNVKAEGKLKGEGVDAGDGAITTTGAVNAGSLTVENASNLKGDVTMDKTLKVTGDTTLQKTNVNDALNVTGASDLKGNVTLGTNATNTVTVNGTANFIAPVNMDKGLTVNGKSDFKEAVEMDNGLTVTNGATSLKKTTVNGKLTAKENAKFEKNVTVQKDLTVNGKLNVGEIYMEHKKQKSTGEEYDSATSITADGISNRAKVTDKNGNTTESKFTHNEEGTFNYAKEEKITGEWKGATSNVTADGVSNEMTDSDGNRHTYSQTATESKEQLVNGNKSNFEKKTAKGNTISITEKDAAGNPISSLTNKQTVDGEKTSVTNKDSSSTINQGADQIRYNVTSKDENTTSSSIEVKADGITNTSKDGTIINDAKDIKNNATGDITNTAQNVTNEGTKSVTNKVGANEVKVFTDGVDIKAEDGKKITESVGTASRVVENDKITDNAGDSTVTTENGQGTTFGKVGSAGTTNIYGDSIKTGTINANDTTTDKLTAGVAADANGGRLTVDADGVKGSYKSGDYTSRSYILPNTLKSGVDNGKEPIDADFVGSRTDHYMVGDKAKLDETVKDADGSNVTNKTSTSTTTTIKDKDGNTTSSEMTSTTITNKAADTIKDQAGDYTVTTDKDNGTTFGKEGSTKTTNIKEDNVTTGTIKATDTITGTLTAGVGEMEEGSRLTVDDNGVKGSVKSDKYTSKSYILKDTLQSGVDNGKDITDNGFVGSRTDHYMDGDKAKLNETVKDADGSNVTKKTSTKTYTEIKDTNGNTNHVTNSATQSKQTLKDKDGNTLTTNQTATKNNFDLKSADGSKENHTTNTVDESRVAIKGENGKAELSTTDEGTTFKHSAAKEALTEGGATNTTIKGNTITTGKVTMDYADVMKDLGVRGNTTLGEAGKDTKLIVNSKATFNEKATFENGAEVKNGLTVSSGGLNVTGESTFNDKVTMNNGLDVTGGVASDSFTVKGTDIKIDSSGINAGGTVISNVADGSISEGSKDAVNGGQLYQVKNDLEGKVNKVGANAAAMANLHPMEFDPDSKWNIAAAMGNYGSETATAIGAFYRPNEDVMVNFSTAFGTGENMVGGGVSVRLGKGSNKLSRQESNALKAQVNDLTARMDALLSVLNPNMSKDFPDVPENHWAYEAVSRLAGNDIVQGYPDGEFHGDRTMTRYEMAEIIYNALSRGAEAERELVEEFKPELQAMAASEKATAERAEG